MAASVHDAAAILVLRTGRAGAGVPDGVKCWVNKTGVTIPEAIGPNPEEGPGARACLRGSKLECVNARWSYRGR
jgi:hypothetical protein